MMIRYYFNRSIESKLDGEYDKSHFTSYCASLCVDDPREEIKIGV